MQPIIKGNNWRVKNHDSERFSICQFFSLQNFPTYSSYYGSEIRHSDHKDAYKMVK